MAEGIFSPCPQKLVSLQASAVDMKRGTQVSLDHNFVDPRTERVLMSKQWSGTADSELT